MHLRDAAFTDAKNRIMSDEQYWAFLRDIASEFFHLRRDEKMFQTKTLDEWHRDFLDYFDRNKL